LISEDLPDRYVTGIAIDPTDDLTAYVTYSGFRNTDYTPHVYKTSIAGQSWEDISGNLPDIPVNDILIQEEPFRIYVATDMGVWYTQDDGANWEILGDNLPPTIMSHLKYHEPTNSLYVGTFGRSIYSFNLAQIDAISVADEFENPLEIDLFPNPASDVLTIRTGAVLDANYTIYDIKGDEIVSGRMISKSEKIQVRDLQSGIYSIHITLNDRRSVKRFQVIH
jgi:photosystem II stability/assembly factor-like uncharacterized protein